MLRGTPFDMRGRRRHGSLGQGVFSFAAEGGEILFMYTLSIKRRWVNLFFSHQ
jgi:hypothetical protein